MNPLLKRQLTGTLDLMVLKAYLESINTDPDTFIEDIETMSTEDLEQFMKSYTAFYKGYSTTATENILTSNTK
jgi:sulfur relay (sulfurtransferase) DsrF/TusC family protein